MSFIANMMPGKTMEGGGELNNDFNLGITIKSRMSVNVLTAYIF